VSGSHQFRLQHRDAPYHSIGGRINTNYMFTEIKFMLLIMHMIIIFTHHICSRVLESRVNVSRFGLVCALLGDRGGTVVKVLCYKSEGRWFNSRWCHWNFSLALSFRSHYGPGVESASNRNEYQEYFLGGKKRPVRKADNLTTILGRCRVVCWNPLGTSDL